MSSRQKKGLLPRLSRSPESDQDDDDETETIRGSQNRPVLETSLEETSLPPLFLKFINLVKYGDTQGAVRFIRSHPQILETQHYASSIFVTTAADMWKRGQEDIGRNILEKALYLSHCASLKSVAERDKYLDRLRSMDGRLAAWVKEDFQKLVTACVKKADMLYSEKQPRGGRVRKSPQPPLQDSMAPRPFLNSPLSLGPNFADMDDQYSIMSRHPSNQGALFPRGSNARHDHRTQSQNLEVLSRSMLSSGQRELVMNVPLGDYIACRNFLRKNPGVLDETNQLPNFGREAINACMSGQYEYSRNCTEKGLICYDLSSRDDEERKNYLHKLATDDPKLLRYLGESFQRAWTNVETQCKGKGSDTKIKQIIAPSRHDPGPSIDEIDRRTNEITLRSSATINVDQNMRSYSIEDALKSHRHKPLSRISEDAQNSPNLEEKIGRHDSLMLDSSSMASMTTMRAMDGTEDAEFDVRFHVRFGRDAREFWCVYRVFALIWHSEDTGQLPEDDLSDWLTKGKRGQIFRSCVNLMAVVKVGPGFCWAIPINTYGGRGVGKFNKKELIDAHAIIHSADREPEHVSKKEPSMKKEPIAVDMACGQRRLHNASRINFAKVHTVEFNVRAMRIGIISSKSRENFKQYWEETLGR